MGIPNRSFSATKNSFIFFCAESFREFWRKVPGKLLENISRIAECFKFEDFGHQERQTCREHWVHIAPGPCADLACRVFFEIDSYSLLEFFFSDKKSLFRECFAFSQGQGKEKEGHP